MKCEACGHDMPESALDTFNDADGGYQGICRDIEACEARVRGARETPGTTSFVMDAVNALVKRVEELEAWQRSHTELHKAQSSPFPAAPTIVRWSEPPPE